MKKIIGLIIAALLIIGIVAGGTWAYFSDTETSTGNTLTAGTLNLTADETGSGTVAGALTPGDDGVNEYLTLSNLKPNDSGTITWLLTNTGSLPGIMTITSTDLFEENTATEPETSTLTPATPLNNNGSNGDLDEYVGVTLWRDSTKVYGGATNTDYMPLSGLKASLNTETDKAMAASGTLTYVLKWAIASDVKTTGTDGEFNAGDVIGVGGVADVDDNILQSDKATLNITFTLIQS